MADGLFVIKLNKHINEEEENAKSDRIIDGESFGK